MSAQDFELDKGLPAAVEAEKAILGGILLENSLSAEVLSTLEPADMYLTANRQILEAVKELAERDHPIELPFVAEELTKKKLLAAVGGVAYLSSLTEGTAKRTSLSHYITIVREKAILRRLVDLCNASMMQALDGADSASECLSGLQEAILGIEARNQVTAAQHVSEFMPQVLADLERQSKQEGLIGLTTGIRGVDRLTTGMRAGELWVLGALAGRGKSALAVQALKANAQNGVPGLMFSLEMDRFQLGCRLLAAHSPVSAWDIRNPNKMAKEKWGPLMQAEGEIENWPLWINDASRMKLGEMMMRAKLYIRRFGIKLIVVDYLMLVDAPGKELREKADAIARGMKAIAKTEKVAVLLLSQFKRPTNINDEPNLTWFKESGGIEAEANVALALHREQEGNEFTGNDKVLIVKNREGVQGSIEVTCHKDRLQFFDREG